MTPTAQRPAPSRRLPLPLCAALIFLAVGGCGPASSNAPTATVALVGVQVLPMTAGEDPGILGDQTVLVDGEEIVVVGPRRLTPVPAGAQVIEGNGRYLMPGLIDSHVHIDHPSELTIYAAYGVTTVVNLRGLPIHLRLREELAAGERFGPTLFTTGDYMDGYPPTMQPMMAFEGVEDAAASVRAQKEAGYDFVKVYTRLGQEQIEAIGAAAREVGIGVIGHGGRGYSLATAVAAGQVNFAHGQDLIRWYLEGLDDEAGKAAIFEALAGSAATLTPNLAFTDGLLRQGEDLEALLAQPDARWLHPALLQPFRRANNRYVRDAETWVPEVRERLAVEMELVRRLREAGVPLLVGTDASTSGVYPGDSAHREIALLREAGLSPYAALTAATREPGAFLQRHRDPALRLGQVAPGFQADLLLLTANPLESVANTRQIAGVLLRGRWHSKSALDVRLEGMAERFASLGESVVELEGKLFSGQAEEARRLFDRLRAEDPEAMPFSQYVPFFVGYGYLYGEDGFSDDPERLEVALGLYQMYAEVYPDRHSSHYLLGRVYEALGRLEEARRSYEAAMEIHPFYPDARKALTELPAGG